MKNIFPLLAILVLWAQSAIGADFPPYNSAVSGKPFFYTEEIDQLERDIEIFPNPVTEGRLTIKSVESFRSLQILNITGEVVFNQEYPAGSTSETVELDKLQKGIYLVRIGFAGKVNHTEKIMIK
jgi:hypothetical protein